MGEVERQRERERKGVRRGEKEIKCGRDGEEGREETNPKMMTVGREERVRDRSKDKYREREREIERERQRDRGRGRSLRCRDSER